MKRIALIQGYVALVDDVDSDLLLRNWHILKTHSTNYARGKSHGRTLLLHRLIMERIIGRPLRRDEEVDHIDGNGLNNRRNNIRMCTRSQNSANKRVYANNKSGFKGVMWAKDRQKWVARITVCGEVHFLGNFDVIADAAQAYRTAAVAYFGQFARF